MKSTIARAKPQKGCYLGDHRTHSKLVSGGKKSLIEEALFFLNRPSVHAWYGEGRSKDAGAKRKREKELKQAHVYYGVQYIMRCIICLYI